MIDDGEIVHTGLDKRRSMSRHRSGRTTATPPRGPALWASQPATQFEAPEVFGQYPQRFLPWAYERIMLRGSPDVLHVCSGALSAETRGLRVDLRRAVAPDIVADGTDLPFADASFDGVLIDPPYSVEYARELYGVTYPRPSALLREACRVLRPGRRCGFLHYLVPNPATGLRLVEVHGITTGCGYRIRAFTVFEKPEEGSLFGGWA